jgi:hypothetical protein
MNEAASMDEMTVIIPIWIVNETFAFTSPPFSIFPHYWVGLDN